jgi:glycosyltransferase involved in cell wall biosynthesis
MAKWDASGAAFSSLLFGVNVAGYVASEKGVGEAIRSTVRALDAEGIPHVINPVTDSRSRNIDNRYSDLREDNPYGVNLVHVNAELVPAFLALRGPEYFRDRYNIGCWTWELSQFPEEWLRSFEPFNEIWTPSTFVADSVARLSPIPVVRVPYSLDLRSNRRGGDVSRLMPPGWFVFFFAFDFDSVFERKNPLGIVRAFRRAFSPKDRILLIVKSSHAELCPDEWRLLQAAAEDVNIRILDAVLSRPELDALMMRCDCYVSLHRSEGFGFTMAEAMSFGKPVIATAYSANMDFMTPANSFLVRYRPAQIDRDHGPYRKGWTWADPDLEHAAELMRLVYEDQDMARGIGERARTDVSEALHPAAVGRLIQERLVRIARTRGSDTNILPESRGELVARSKGNVSGAMG